ncbi:hypothetical protein ACFLZQ_04185 [Thermodesulfobacteriota bacterium]
MCYDDFDFDGYDGMDDPDDDFQEDMFDEFEPEQDELDLEAESDEPVYNESDDPESAFDFQDAFILGGMILGQAYEEALDEKEQQRQQIKKKKDED